ncbi:hypothetical protein Ancab_028850 [Ancistrocladus abbreviatus]
MRGLRAVRRKFYRRILHPGPSTSWRLSGALAVSRGFLFCWVDGWDWRTAFPLSLLYSGELAVALVNGDEELGARCFPFRVRLFVMTVFGGVGGGPVRGWCCRVGSSTIAKSFVAGSCGSVLWGGSG